MTTLSHRHNYACRLKAELDVDHDTPLIEWHDWAPGVIADPAAPVSSNVGAGVTSLTVGVPAGAVMGSLVLLTGSAFGFGANIACADPRVELVAGVGDFNVWAGHLYDQDDGTAWDDPFVFTGTGMVVPRMTGHVVAYEPGLDVGQVSEVALSATKTTAVPVLDDVAAVAVLARAWDDTAGSSITPAVSGYQFVGIADWSLTRTAVFHWSNGGELGSNPAGPFTANGDPGALLLFTVEIKRAAAGPGGLFEWVLNPDRTDALMSYTSSHGRRDPMSKTAPLNGSVRLARLLAGDLIPESGDRFRITINADVAAALELADDERPRFTGEITEVEVSAEGDSSVISIVALGRQTRLNRLPVTLDRPADLDGERVRRILVHARLTLPLLVGTIEPGTVTVLPDAPRAVNAQQLIDAVTDDALSQLVEHRTGRLDYHDANHRRGRTSVLTLTGADHLIKPFAWRQTVGSVYNDATATYGPDDNRRQIRVVDPESADPDTGVGPYGAQFDTQLASELDAYALLTNLVGRFSRPAWWLPSMLVELFRTAGDRLPALLAVKHGDKITATDLPPDGAFTAGDVFVEGTTETADAHTWRLDLAVADPTLAGAGLRWVDLPRFLRWVDVDPEVTWLDVATMTDPYELGRPVAEGGDGVDAISAFTVDGGDDAGRDWHYDYVLEGTP